MCFCLPWLCCFTLPSLSSCFAHTWICLPPRTAPSLPSDLSCKCLWRPEISSSSELMTHRLLVMLVAQVTLWLASMLDELHGLRGSLVQEAEEIAWRKAWSGLPPRFLVNLFNAFFRPWEPLSRVVPLGRVCCEVWMLLRSCSNRWQWLGNARLCSGCVSSLVNIVLHRVLLPCAHQGVLNKCWDERTSEVKKFLRCKN